MTDAELHRQAYNSAFDALGLAWHWDRDTYATLPDGPHRVRAFVEFLARAIHAKGA